MYTSSWRDERELKVLVWVELAKVCTLILESREALCLDLYWATRSVPEMYEKNVYSNDVSLSKRLQCSRVFLIQLQIDKIRASSSPPMVISPRISKDMCA